MPLQLVLDRVLDGDDLQVGRLILSSAGVERGGLAGAGGAGDQQDAVRPVDQRLEVAAAPSGAKPELIEAAGTTEERSRSRMTMRLAVDGGDGGDADVDPPAACAVTRMRPSWGRRRSAMFISAMILMREVTRGLEPPRRRLLRRSSTPSMR